MRSPASSRPGCPPLEVVIFTAVTSTYALRRIYESDVKGFLLKTDPEEELLFGLETVRRGHPFRSRAVTELCDRLGQTGAGVARLTRRECEILGLIAKGYSTKEIATELGVSHKTIETHRSHLFKKLRIHSVAEAVCFAVRHRLIEL